MPNQRQEDKRKVGVWLSPEEMEALDRVAIEMGLTKSDVLKAAITKRIKMMKEDADDKNRND